MATTTNIGLTKPGYEGFTDVSVIDGNMDRIDAKFDKIPGETGILDAVYPVGSIYMSVVSTDPGTLFGGTWAALEDRFLIGKSTTYAKAGGSATKKLKQDNLPPHSHELNNHTHMAPAHQHMVGNGANNGFATFDTESDIGMTMVGFQNKTSGGMYFAGHSEKTARAGSAATSPATGNTTSTGNGDAFDIMPPYLPVYMWKRTA